MDQWTHDFVCNQFTTDNTKAQKYLLRGIELTIKCFKKDLLPKTSHVLKAFYDNDILEEKPIVDWGAKVSERNACRDALTNVVRFRHTKRRSERSWPRRSMRKPRPSSSG